MPDRDVCSVCGRDLPNRYAVAGRCGEPGCTRAFCAFHWHNGNGRCPEHGWMPGGRLSPRGSGGESGHKEVEMVEGSEVKNICESADKSLPSEKKASILKQIGAFAVRLGSGAGGLVKKLSGVKSTEEAMREIEAQIAENRARREPVSRRYEELYAFIVAKKKAYQSSPPARRKVLELELKSAIAEYQSLERQMTAYLNNETILTKVRGRMCELVAMGLKGVSEDQIDKLTDKIEDAADANVDIDGAIGDLDKAGVRREREDGSFEDALAAFGDDVPESPEDAAGPSAETASAEPGKDPLSDF